MHSHTHECIPTLTYTWTHGLMGSCTMHHARRAGGGVVVGVVRVVQVITKKRFIPIPLASDPGIVYMRVCHCRQEGSASKRVSQGSARESSKRDRQGSVLPQH